MTPGPVTLFVFAGRRPNLEIQLPFIRAILDRHPNTEFHVWNLARDHGDARFLQTIEGDRITVFNEYRRCSPGYDKVYKHYADDQYRHHTFAKVDDDVLFLQVDRFGLFIKAVREYPAAIVSANVINNGACLALEPALREGLPRLGVPLLDVHKSAAFAAMSHNYFFDHRTELLTQPVDLFRTEDWLSINTIGYTWEMGRKIARLIGSKCEPRMVAGRELGWLGDEGVANTVPRILMRGFLACHLSFGPQNLMPWQLLPWRERYTQAADEYLAQHLTPDTADLPALSPVVYGQRAEGTWRQRWAAEHADPDTGNNPLLGRFTP